jgi:hypothetical protein
VKDRRNRKKNRLKGLPRKLKDWQKRLKEKPRNQPSRLKESLRRRKITQDNL